MRYIEMHRGLASYVVNPPPARGGDIELEGGVNACHVEYVYESRDSHVQGTDSLPSNGVEISLLPLCTSDISI